MANTMTYATAIDFAIKALGDTNPEAVERLKALTAQLAKRSSKTGPTKTQKENEVIKGLIIEILEEVEGFIPMAELLADPRVPEGTSTQKMGALLRQLINDEKVEKNVYKKRTFYAIAGTEFVAPDAKADEGEDA